MVKTVNVQIGWKYEGANIVSSTGYKKDIFVQTGKDVVVEHEVRGYYSRNEDKAYQMVDVTLNTGSTYRYERDQAIGNKFEVLIVERMGDKIISSKIVSPEPYMADVEIEVPDEESPVEGGEEQEVTE